MKFKKLLAGVCAMSIAASMMAVSASAAATKPTEPTFPGSVTLNAKGTGTDGEGASSLQDALTTESKMVQIPLKDIQPTDASATIVNVTMRLSATNAPEAGWTGGGGAIGFNTGAETDDWEQSDTANAFGEDSRVKIGVDENGDDIFDRDLNVADCTWTESWDFENLVPLTEEDYDMKNEDGNYANIMQFGWWWGAGETVDILEWTVTYSDGEKFTIVSIEAWVNYEKELREYNAAAALEALEAKIDEIGVDDIVASTETAADALTNAKDAIAEIDAAIKNVDTLNAAVEEAQAAFDALQEGDEADTEAFAAAKKAVEDATGKLEAAKKTLNDAISAFNDKMAEQLAAKDEEIKKLEEEKAALEAELEAAQKDAAANADKIKDLEAQIAAKDEEIAAKDAEIEELKKNPPAVSGTENNGSSTGTSTGTGTGAGTGAGTDFQGKNPATGATAGLALAGLALAGVAVVATKKRK